jgi:hypothetical protein
MSTETRHGASRMTGERIRNIVIVGASTAALS